MDSAPFTQTVATADVVAPPSGDVTPFAFLVVDAEYSRALDQAVLLSDDTKVVTLDVSTGDLTGVALPLAGLAISVSLDGTRAVVGHDGYVSELTLSPLAVVQTIAVTAICGDVVLGAGFAYCFPAVDQWVELHNVNLTTGAETLGPGYSLYAGTVARMHSSGERMYGANRGSRPRTSSATTSTTTASPA